MKRKERSIVRHSGWPQSRKHGKWDTGDRGGEVARRRRLRLWWQRSQPAPVPNGCPARRRVLWPTSRGESRAATSAFCAEVARRSNTGVRWRGDWASCLAVQSPRRARGVYESEYNIRESSRAIHPRAPLSFLFPQMLELGEHHDNTVHNSRSYSSTDSSGDGGGIGRHRSSKSRNG
jgi:hypothetical protein